MATCSFFDRLTRFKYTDHEATDLIRFLIRVLAHDAGLARRNSLTVYKLVETFVTISDGLGDLIVKVDNDTDASSWDDYDAFTTAIHPLEEILFELTAFTEKPEFGAFLPTDLPISDLIESIDAWKTTRNNLRGFLGRAYQEFPKFLNANGQAYSEEKHDDLVLLSALCKNIRNHSLTDGEVASGAKMRFITALKSVAGVIPALAKSATDEGIVESIRSTMLVYAVMVVSKSGTQNESARDVRSSGPVWQQAVKLLGDVKRHLEKSAAPPVTVVDLGTEWEKLKDLLTKLEAILPQEYIDLRKKARTVRRPYHARTLLLVSMCRDLANHFLRPGNNIARNLPPLQRALEAAIKAITEASTQYGAFAKGLDCTSVDQTFADALDEIDKAFGVYGLPSRKAEVPTELKKDQDHVKKLNDKYDDFGSKQTQGSSSVQVKVNFGGKDSPPYTIDTKARLSTVLWLLAADFSTHRTKILEATHFTLGSQVLGFDDVVPPGGGTLKLVLCTSRFAIQMSTLANSS